MSTKFVVGNHVVISGTGKEFGYDKMTGFITEVCDITENDRGIQYYQVRFDIPITGSDPSIQLVGEYFTDAELSLIE